MIYTRGPLALLLIFSSLSAFTFCQSRPPDPISARADDRVSGWTSDIDFLLAEIRKQHYVYKSQPLPEALIKKADELKKAIPRFSDERMLVELQRLISLVGDGHSYVLPAGASRFLNVREDRETDEATSAA